RTCCGSIETSLSTLSRPTSRSRASRAPAAKNVSSTRSWSASRTPATYRSFYRAWRPPGPMSACPPLSSSLLPTTRSCRSTSIGTKRVCSSKSDYSMHRRCRQEELSRLTPSNPERSTTLSYRPGSDSGFSEADHELRDLELAVIPLRHSLEEESCCVDLLTRIPACLRGDPRCLVEDLTNGCRPVNQVEDSSAESVEFDRVSVAFE